MAGIAFIELPEVLLQKMRGNLLAVFVQLTILDSFVLFMQK
jgi:hypothetical protein